MTDPYYCDDQVTLYHGDCLEIDAWLEADVLVTDPPYGIGWSVPQGAFNSHLGRRKHDVGHHGIQGDGTTAVRDDILRAWETKPAIVFGAVNAAPPPGSKQTLIWHKPDNAGIFGSIGGWRRDVEAIHLIGSWPQIPAARSSVMRSNAKALATYVLRGHPHSKPLDVMESLISATAGVVADPFAGSGSTLIAARNLGRKAVGVEIEERYCEVIARRLDQMALDFGEGA